MQINGLQKCACLIPITCDYVRLHGKGGKKVAGEIKGADELT